MFAKNAMVPTYRNFFPDFLLVKANHQTKSVNHVRAAHVQTAHVRVVFVRIRSLLI